MMQRLQLCLCFCLLMLAVALPTWGIMSDDESQRPLSDDTDYANGIAAFERADWQAVIDSMAKVVERRPWRDNAYNLMGFAYRKLGNYRSAIKHYHKALDLNPHNRGALEYLGETYLELHCVVQAHEVLSRLETACKRITADLTKDTWLSDCAEWQELKTAIDAARSRDKSDCALH
jgi:tetratricopeptide (TPR) repeat protein